MSHRIVVAEDEADIRANLIRLLALEDYQVWAAPNGREALQLVRQHLPDIVLSDMMMTEMTRHQRVQALRADPLTAWLGLFEQFFPKDKWSHSWVEVLGKAQQS